MDVITYLIDDYLKKVETKKEEIQSLSNQLRKDVGFEVGTKFYMCKGYIILDFYISYQEHILYSFTKRLHEVPDISYIVDGIHRAISEHFKPYFEENDPVLFKDPTPDGD